MIKYIFPNFFYTLFFIISIVCAFGGGWVFASRMCKIITVPYIHHMVKYEKKVQTIGEIEKRLNLVN